MSAVSVARDLVQHNDLRRLPMDGGAPSNNSHRAAASSVSPNTDVFVKRGFFDKVLLGGGSSSNQKWRMDWT